DEHAARAAAAELGVPLCLQAVAFLLADDLVGADDGTGQGAVLVDRLLHRVVIAAQGDLLVAGAERTEAAVVGVARVGIAKVDDLFGLESLLLALAAILVEIDDVRAERAAARLDILAWQNPDCVGDAEGADVELPEGAAVHLLVKRSQLPQVE